MVVALRYGAPVKTSENLRKLALRQRFYVAAARATDKDFRDEYPVVRSQGDLGGCGWRNANIFRPKAEDLLKKLRRLRSNSWLDSMTKAFVICLQGDELSVGVAEEHAKDANEREYFLKVMLPILRSRSDQRKKGLRGSESHLSDLLSIIFPTN